MFEWETFSQCPLVHPSLNDFRGVMQNLSRDEWIAGNGGEYQTFVSDVVGAITELGTSCEQLSQAVLYLSTFRPTLQMKRARINRYKHLVYHIEDYIIRTQFVNERILKLINAVFKLNLSSEECKYKTIINKPVVRATTVPQYLDSLRGLMSQVQDQRNEIVHHRSYSTKELSNLEMVYHLHEEILPDDEDYERWKHLPELAEDMAREVVRNQTQQLNTFNEAILAKVYDLLAQLEPYYQQQISGLRHRNAYNVPDKDA